MSFLATFADPGMSLQEPFDAAVVMPTLLRPQLAEALASIFAQDFAGRVQLLIGIDIPQGDVSMVERACAARPSNHVVQLFHPGYSTSVRHCGLGEAQDGGVLRSVLTLLANSRRVAYLDDDNWWHPYHLRHLVEVLADLDYAFSLRLFVHPKTGRIVSRDDWESVGPGKGIYVEKYGGFIDPNCLMIDKLRCPEIAPLWNCPQPADPRGMSADRGVFMALANRHTGGATNQPTVFYRLDPADSMHKERMKAMAAAYEAAGSAS